MAGVTKNNRILAANVRTIALSQIEKVLNGNDEEFKKALLLKLAGSILPKLNEHTGEDGEPIKFNLINYGQLGDSLPVQSSPLPTESTESTPEV